MNWDAIGAIAELLGSVAVIATLGYLAVQVRHSRSLLEENRKITLSQVYQARADTRREQMKHISDSTHLAEVLGKVGVGNGGPIDLKELSETEKVRLWGHYGHIYFHQENNIYQFELGLIDQRTMDLTTKTINHFMPAWVQLGLSGTGRVEEWYETHSDESA